jgi:hypothetical protein
MYYQEVLERTNHLLSFDDMECVENEKIRRGTDSMVIS